MLPHDERHLRRRAIELGHGDKVLVDLPEPVTLADGDRLVLEDGRHVEIVAADEESTISARATPCIWPNSPGTSATGISPRRSSADRILILRDHVIKAMLEGLGATVTEVVEPFKPVRGAYSGGHGHRIMAMRTIMATITTITIMATITGMANATLTAVAR